MSGMRLVVLLLWVAPSALAGSFGGFSGDGTRVLDGEQVCKPAEIDIGDPVGRPVCQPRGPGLSFTKPPVSSDLTASFAKGSLRVMRGKEVVTAHPGKKSDRVAGVFVSADGHSVVIERRVGTKVEVLAARFARTVLVDPVSFQRAVGRGGAFEQRIQACERAGVRLDLSSNQKFKLSIETRCQAERDKQSFAGTWETATDGLVLAFPEDEGVEEKMTCRFGSCDEAPGEDCLSCADEDVSFTLSSRSR